MTIAVGVEQISIVYKLNREEIFFSVELIEVNFIVRASHCDQGIMFSYLDHTGAHLSLDNIQYFTGLVIPYFNR